MSQRTGRRIVRRNPLLSLTLAASFGAVAALPGDAQETPAPTTGSSWPGFRGNGSGWTAASGLPTSWSEPSWEADLPGYGQSAPVVWGDRVVVTSVAGPEKELAFVSCLRLSDGLELWRRSIDAATRIENSEMVSRGAPTPCIDAERVYAFFESGDLVCLDHDGSVLWQLDLFERFGPFQGNHGIGASPVAVDSTVFVLLDHAGPSHLLALDAATGEDRWVVEREPRVSWATPVCAADAGELIVSSNGTVEGFAIADGTRLWAVDGIEGNTVPSPTVVGERVVIGRSKGAGLAVVRRSGATAELVWAGDELSPSGFASPIVFGQSALLVNKAGALSSVALESGELQWQERLSCGGLWASPITDGELVWLFGKQGVTSVVRCSAEGPEEVSVNELESPGGVHGVAAIDGAFLVREPSRLLCLRAQADGAPLDQ